MNSLDPCTSTIACLSWNACKKGCLLENNERRDFVSGDPTIDWAQYSMSFCPIQSQYEEHMGEGYGWQAREGKFLYGEGLRLKWEQLLTIESLIIPSKISLPFVSWGLNEKKLNWVELKWKISTQEERNRLWVMATWSEVFRIMETQDPTPSMSLAPKHDSKDCLLKTFSLQIFPMRVMVIFMAE